MGETLPIEVKVANNDDRKMNVALSVFLQPTDDGEDDGEFHDPYMGVLWKSLNKVHR